MNEAWNKGAQSVDYWISRYDEPDEEQSFERKLDLPLKWGNKDAAAFHKFKAFASAIIKDAELSQAIKESLSQALAEGKTLRDWRKSANTIFDKKGLTRLNNWQAETIYRTETTMAYGAGQYAKLQEVKNRFPYWQYVTAGDERVRDSHRALDGKIFKAGDPQYYPPVGFNCRCKARPISKRQAAKRGITGPDTVTPKMRADLQNAEFIGDKVGNFKDWIEEKIKSITPEHLVLIEQAHAQLLDDTAANTFIPAQSKKEAIQRLENLTERGKAPYNDLSLNSLNEVLRGTEPVLKRYGIKIGEFGYARKKRANGIYTQYGGTKDSISIKKTAAKTTKKDLFDRYGNDNEWIERTKKNILLKKSVLEKWKSGHYIASEGVRKAQIEKLEQQIESLQNIKRWSTSSAVQKAGVRNNAASIMAHESYHAVYYRKHLEATFAKQLQEQKVKKPDWYKVSEYAATSKSELFAETGAAIEIGLDVPDNIKKAFLNTVETVL